MTVGAHQAIGTMVPPWAGGGPQGPVGPVGPQGPAGPAVSVDPFTYAGSGGAVSLDVSAGNTLFQQTDTLTGDLALTLTNGIDGVSGIVALCQDGAGGHKITGITVAGRTVLMRDDLTTINTTAFLVAAAKSLLAFQYGTVNGVAVVWVSIITGIAAAFT